jgi:hypothetical protein
MNSMKRIFTFLFICFGLTFFVNGQCPAVNYIFQTQSQIDNFSINYPSCTKIYNIQIVPFFPSSISNLSGLSQITEVEGNVNIQSSNISSLNGLQNITKIGTSLDIFGNNNLTNLSGLNSLRDLSSINFKDNANMTSLSGLNLTTLSNVIIDNCDKLINFTNLSSVSINNLTIQNSDGVIDLTGISCLNPNFFIYLGNNNGITSMSGLNLGSSANSVGIESMPKLTNISPLSNLTNVNTLGISNNDMLTNSGFNVFNNLTTVNSLQISDNQLITNLSSFSSLSNIRGYLLIKDNPSLISISGLTSLTSFGVPNTHITATNFRIINNDALLNFNGLNLIQVNSGGIEITDNASLQDLNGLSKLTKVAGPIYIGFNPSLSNIDGLNNINYMGSPSTRFNPCNEQFAAFSVVSNAALTSIKGIGNLDLTKMCYIYIENNSNLSTCNALSVCNFINNPNKRAYVSGNKTNCLDDVALQAACSSLPVELITFNAQNIHDAANSGTEGPNKLTWQTASEKNTSHFDIEKSKDGLVFEKIGEVKAAGKSQTLPDILGTGQYYSYLDKNPYDLSYYRLKIHDLDGKVDFSKTVSVRRDGKLNVKIYPNPAQQVMTVDMGEMENGTLTVIDVLGKIVYQKAAVSGQNTMDISTFSKGIYIIEIKTKGITYREKIIKN